MSIVERNMLRDFLRQQVSRIVSLARRDKRFLILLSEGLTCEASHQKNRVCSLNRQWFKLQTLLFIFGIDDYGTGPSLTKETAMCAPNLPDATENPSALNRSLNS